jgi:hypothetical protein
MDNQRLLQDLWIADGAAETVSNGNQTPKTEHAEADDFRIFLAAACTQPLAYAQSNRAPSYQLDGRQNRVLELSNLYPDTDCHPARLAGRVVQRTFDKTGLIIQSVVVEETNGQRSLVNVDTDLENLDMASRGWVVRGFQTLLAEGNRVSLGVKLCGAAGRVIMVDSIRPAR